jgi:hypothetical protein
VVLADHTISRPPSIAVKMNGLEEAARAGGGDFVTLEKGSHFELIGIEGGTTLKEVEAAKLLGESDVLINLPVLKHHEATGSSVGLKNLMGLVRDRTFFHREGLDTTIAELSLGIRPDVTLVDATTTLMSNGPRGPGDLEEMGKVVAGTDPVAVDVACLALAYSLGYEDFDLATKSLYIGEASALGIGESDPAAVSAMTVELDVAGGGGESATESQGRGVPEWAPYASLSAASVGVGLVAMMLDRRRRCANEE